MGDRFYKAAKQGPRSGGLSLDIGFDARDLAKALEGIPNHVAARGLGKATALAMKPMVSQVKMQIGSAMASGVSKKGIRDYKRAIGIKTVLYKKSGAAVSMVGPRTNVTAPSESHKGKQTRWSKLAHFFEFGTSRGIPAYGSITKAWREHRNKAERILRAELVDAIKRAANRHRKVQSMRGK